MKNNLKNIILLLVLSTLSLLTGCSKDEYPQLNAQKIDTDISLEQFKRETGLADFETSIHINRNPNAILARNADGSYELSDFVIHTDVIKKVVVDQKTTYTFQIQSSTDEFDGSFFNLIMYYENGWQSLITELKPTADNLAALKEGTTDKFHGSMKLLFKGDLPSNQIQSCMTVFITNIHCTGCQGECDWCSLCVSTESYTLCGSNPAQAEPYHISYVGPVPGGGGGGNSGVVINPNGSNSTNGEELPIATNLANVNLILGNTNASVINYLSSLSQEEYKIIQQTPALLTYLQNNNASADSINQVSWAINAILVNSFPSNFINEAFNALNNNIEVDFNKRIIYGINKPCQKQIVKDIVDICSPFTELIQQTFDNTESVNIKFSNGSIPSGSAYTNPYPYGNAENFTISIKFDDAFLTSGTNLAIVSATLHELVHAYLINLYMKGTLVATNSNYNTLLNAFIAFYQNQVQETFDPLDNEIHNAMKDFIGRMANSIYNYAMSKNINVSPEYCEQLAWGTMSGTDLFTETLTSNQQQINNNIYHYEQDNIHPQAKGTPCN